jgi:iron-sulfur cluster repair protein YtfE (RIC family)
MYKRCPNPKIKKNLHLLEEISFPMPAVERLNKRAEAKHVVRTFASHENYKRHLDRMKKMTRKCSPKC